MKPSEGKVFFREQYNFFAMIEWRNYHLQMRRTQEGLFDIARHYQRAAANAHIHKCAMHDAWMISHKLEQVEGD